MGGKEAESLDDDDDDAIIVDLFGGDETPAIIPKGNNWMIDDCLAISELFSEESSSATGNVKIPNFPVEDNPGNDMKKKSEKVDSVVNFFSEVTKSVMFSEESDVVSQFLGRRGRNVDRECPDT
jgi:hypothetical protein